MKIAIVSAPYWRAPPVHYGGLELITSNLARGLTELGHKVVLFAPNDSHQPPKGMVVEYGEELGEKAMTMNWVEAEKAVHEKIKPYLDQFDVIHEHNWWGWTYQYKADHPTARVCHTHHGHITWDARQRPAYVTHLIAISQHMKNIYKLAGWDSQYAYNGIDTDMYAPGGTQGDYLLFVGRFDTFKQPLVALNVAKRLDMPIKFIGASKFIQDAQYYRELVDAVSKYPKAEILADLPTEKKIPYIQQAKAVLVPSKMMEPFGLVAVEAMSCGVPAIVLDDGALKELVIDGITGFVCKNEDEMVAACRKVATIDTMTCRQHVQRKFSLQAMAQAYATLYERIVKGEIW